MQYPITLKMADGTDKQFWLSDEKLQFGGGSDNAVTDVLVNGASVVDGGVATIPIANESRIGLVPKISAYYGLSVSNDYVIGVKADKNTFLTRSDLYFVSKGTLNNVLAAPSIMPALTSDEQAAARARMQAAQPYRHIATFTIDESNNHLNWRVEFDENGNRFKLKDVLVAVYAPKMTDPEQTNHTGYVSFENRTLVSGNLGNCAFGVVPWWNTGMDSRFYMEAHFNDNVQAYACFNNSPVNLSYGQNVVQYFSTGNTEYKYGFINSIASIKNAQPTVGKFSVGTVVDIWGVDYVG